MQFQMGVKGVAHFNIEDSASPSEETVIATGGVRLRGRRSGRLRAEAGSRINRMRNWYSNQGY
jgi:hypothetical protein